MWKGVENSVPVGSLGSWEGPGGTGLAWDESRVGPFLSGAEGKTFLIVHRKSQAEDPGSVSGSHGGWAQSRAESTLLVALSCPAVTNRCR